MNLINRQELLKVLKENQSKIFIGSQLFKQALIDARDSHYPTVVPRDPAINLKAKVILSKIDLTSNNQFEIWVEFTVPREEGTVVGTHVYNFCLDGNFSLKETYGTVFRS